MLTWAVRGRLALFPPFLDMTPKGIRTYGDFKADRLGAERRVHHSGFKEGNEEEEFLLPPQCILSKEMEISPRLSAEIWRAPGHGWYLPPLPRDISGTLLRSPPLGCQMWDKFSWKPKGVDAEPWLWLMLA